MAWAKPQYSRKLVDWAGEVIVRDAATPNDLDEAFKIINNWRSSHSYPLLNFHMNLRRKANSIQSDALFSQRIKRMESLVAKLKRDQTSTLKLSQMQDIGGCRAVLSNVGHVRRLIDKYHNSSFAHVLKTHKDYMENPKPDGYRGHHLVYQYQTNGDNSVYNKLRIEIQIRTAQQHAWATAVEAVGLFTKQALKSNQGSEDWLRFFALVSSSIANMEHTNLVPGTPKNRRELLQEIKGLSSKLRVPDTLKAYGATLDYASREKKQSAKYFLVWLNHNQRKVFVTGYSSGESQKANTDYTKREREVQSNEGDHVVLVSVDSINALRRAYPNFFLDTKKFSGLLDRILRAKI